MAKRATGDDAHDYGILDASSEVIAEAFWRTGAAVYQPVEANARVIAAAPDYDKAARMSLPAMEDAISAALGGRALTEWELIRLTEAANAIRAAIRKATEGAP